MEVLSTFAEPQLLNVTIKVTENDYLGKYEDSIRQLSKTVAIKGFRPGKVPPQLIKKMYGKELKGEALNKVVSEKLSETLDANNVIFGPFSEGMEGFGESETTFNFSVVTAATVSDEFLKGCTATLYTVEVADSLVDEEVMAIRNRYGKVEKKETISSKEDYIEAKIEVASLNQTLEKTYILLDKVSDGAREKFFTLKKEETATFQLKDIASEYIAKALKVEMSEIAESDADCQVTILDVDTFVPAEINQTLFDSFFGEGQVNSEEEFRAKVREMLEGQHKNASQNFLGDQIYIWVVNNKDIKLPEAYLIKRLPDIFSSVKPEEAEAKYGSYEQFLRWLVFSRDVAKRENVSVSKREIDAAMRMNAYQEINRMFGAYMGQLPENMLEDLISNYINKNREKLENNSSSELFTLKVIDALKGKVTVVEQAVSLEEFNNLRKELNKLSKVADNEEVEA